MLGIALGTLAMLLATAEAEAQASPLKLESTLRAGYALVKATAASGKEPKQVEWIVTATSGNEVTYDTIGAAGLVVTLPANGSVTVHAVALLDDGKLAAPTSLTLSTPAKAAAQSAEAISASSGLRVTFVVHGPPNQAESDLLSSQSLRVALQAHGYRWLWTYTTNERFWQTLEEAAKQYPKIPREPPFLFVQDANQRFLAAYPLHLSDSLAENTQAILKIFGGDK